MNLHNLKIANEAHTWTNKPYNCLIDFSSYWTNRFYLLQYERSGGYLFGFNYYGYSIVSELHRDLSISICQSWNDTRGIYSLANQPKEH